VVNKKDILEEMKRHNKVLMEHMEKQVSVVSEQHGFVVRKLEEHDGRFDKIEQDMTVVKADQHYMKLAIKEVDRKVEKLDKRTGCVETRLDNVDHKLDTALVNHGERITKLEHRTT